MPYIKQNFQTLQSREQPLRAEHLIKMEDGILEAYSGIQRVESYVNDKPMVNLRDLESGVYMLYGYFSPYQDSDSTIAVDNELVHVARLDAGSHIMSISPLNAKIGFVEILVDDAGYHGHTFTRQSFDMLAINGLLDRVAAMEGAISMTDTATGKEYRLTVNNAKLTMEEVTE